MADVRSISMPPNFSGNHHGGQAQLGRLAQNRDRDAGLLVLDRFQIRRHFFVPEFLGGARDGAMLVGEILGREDLVRRGRFEQKGTALVFGGSKSCSCHNANSLPVRSVAQ